MGEEHCCLRIKFDHIENVLNDGRGELWIQICDVLVTKRDRILKPKSSPPNPAPAVVGLDDHARNQPAVHEACATAFASKEADLVQRRRRIAIRIERLFQSAHGTRDSAYRHGVR
jgi:hypothetical protein